MAGNSFGECFRITTFGESHGLGLGVVIDGLVPGFEIDVDALQHELDRRRPGQSKTSTSRREPDTVEVLSGVFEGRTTGAPVALLFRNLDARSGDYSTLKDLFRPGHADYSWWQKYGIRDHRGGGRSSGRETIARVAAGAIAKQILAAQGVTIVGHVIQIEDVVAAIFEPDEIEGNDVRCADPEAAALMVEAIERARSDGDSVGGTIEVIANGAPPGWGDPVFDKLEAMLGSAMLSIGAVKGVEFGDGFNVVSCRGSETNDELTPEGFATNHSGGILGGISTGQPIVMRLAVKPTPSIAKSQRTLDLRGEPTTVEAKGRHDPCICPRLVPVAEAMTAIVLLDACLRHRAIVGVREPRHGGQR